MSIAHDFATAIETGDVETVKQILAHHPELANSNDWTPPPLHCAVLWNQPQIAKVLLDSGADLEMHDPDRQTTPLRYAILYAKKEMIPILLARGANAGPIKENGTTAMELSKRRTAASRNTTIYLHCRPTPTSSRLFTLVESNSKKPRPGVAAGPFLICKSLPQPGDLWSSTERNQT